MKLVNTDSLPLHSSRCVSVRMRYRTICNLFTLHAYLNDKNGLPNVVLQAHHVFTVKENVFIPDHKIIFLKLFVLIIFFNITTSNINPHIN